MYSQKEGSQPTPIWTLTGEQDDDWFQGKAGFIINSDHSVLIEARIAQTSDGDIAIDDISITNGYCPTYPQYAVPDGSLTTTVPTTVKVLVRKKNSILSILMEYCF